MSTSNNTKKAFVIGGSGGVGKQLVGFLLKEGYTVTATHRRADAEDELEEMGATPLQMDLEDISVATLTRELKGYPLVFFCAGSGGKNVFEVDRDGAVNVATALIEHKDEKPHLVILSSLGCDQAEKMPKSLTDYAKAKKEADDLILSMALKGVKSTIVRPGTLTDGDLNDCIVVKLAKDGQHVKGESLMERFDEKEMTNSRAAVAKTMMESAEVFGGDIKCHVFEMVEGNGGQPIRQALLAIN